MSSAVGYDLNKEMNGLRDSRTSCVLQNKVSVGFINRVTNRIKLTINLYSTFFNSLKESIHYLFEVF